LATAVLVIAMSACNEKKSKDSIIGSWIMPIEGQPGKMQGIKPEEGGDASSINMATLAYKYWEQRGDELYLTVKSIGNGMEIENHYFILAAIASSTPSATPKIAANKTLTSSGNKKVMV
jgi:hypothetical protein